MMVSFYLKPKGFALEHCKTYYSCEKAESQRDTRMYIFFFSSDSNLSYSTIFT